MVDFESVYLEYYLTVYRFAYSLCRNEHLAEEISQETFLKAFNSFSEFRGDCTVRTWLCQIAKNLCYSDVYKRQMQEGYSTAPDEVRSLGFGAGMGLPNMKKYTDDIHSDTELGVGTTVYMTVRI